MKIGMLLGYIHFIFLSVWLFFSTIFYGIIIILSSFVNHSLTNHFARLWARQLLFFAGVKLTISGLENIDKKESYIFVSNHSSVLDIPVLYTALPIRTGFIAKKELFKIPLFGQVMRASGSLMLDRNRPKAAKGVLKKAIEKVILEKSSIVIFPEGTRNKYSDVPGKFKSGSFFAAENKKLKLIPVYIGGSGSVIVNGFIPQRLSKLTVRFGEPILYNSGISRAMFSEIMRDKVISLMPK